MLYPTMAEQFARRQAAWKPNMDIVEDASLYRVDGYLQGDYVPPSETNEHEMQCFDVRSWQLVVHDDGSDCDPAEPPPRPPLLLGRPRPPIVEPIECGDVYCYPGETSDFNFAKIYNFRNDEWCENPLVPKITYEPQSTEDYENAGAFDEDC
jgi:hypothetical protein